MYICSYRDVAVVRFDEKDDGEALPGERCLFWGDRSDIGPTER